MAASTTQLTPDRGGRGSIRPVAGGLLLAVGLLIGLAPRLNIDWG